MNNNDKIAARVTILPEFYDEKRKTMVNLKEYYEEWYSFNEKEIDVCIYSESFINKEKTLKEVTYYYRLPDNRLKLIPKKHCKVIFEFL